MNERDLKYTYSLNFSVTVCMMQKNDLRVAGIIQIPANVVLLLNQSRGSFLYIEHAAQADLI